MPTERKNITQPAEWWVAFSAAADACNLTLSEWMAECCIEFLPPTVRKRLPDRPPAHRPKTPE